MQIFEHRSIFSPLQRCFSNILVICLLLNLYACATTSPPTRSDLDPMSQEERASQALTPKERLREFDRQANATELPNKRAYYQLLAMELLMEYGKSKETEKRLQHLDLRALDRSYRYRVDVLHAQLALSKNKAPIALQKLPKYSIDYPIRVQAAILRTRAISLSKLGYYLESFNTRLALDQVLSQLLPEKIKRRQANHQVIWSLLQAMPEPLVTQIPQDDPIEHGWRELALNVRTARKSGLDQELAVNNWRSRFPKHPAIASLGRMLGIDEAFDFQYPGKVAVLLPLSGRFAKQAKAIRDGILAAYYGHDARTRPSIRFYDTGSDPSQIWLHYQAAIDEGAELVVGPLHKNAVTELVNAAQLPRPVLALNYAASNELSSEQLIQFGLLPEDEARQAAEMAIIKDQIRAVVFAPNNSYGARLSQAFTERYTELGGKVVAIEKYAPNTSDHTHPIKRALNVLQSNNRASILRTVLKRSIKFEPRRRQDVDAIFLIATNGLQAFNFRSQLKFHNSSDISIYSTSRVTDTSKISQRDKHELDGIVFTDTPWTLQGSNNTNYALANRYWPKTIQKYSALYALGLDAYRIIPYLKRLKSSPIERFPGLTGSISLNADNKIHRELLWASFNEGQPKAMEFSSIEEHQLDEAAEDDISYLDSL